MNECTYKNYDELPLMLNVVQVAAVLGISRAGAYELVHSVGFPTLRSAAASWCRRTSCGSGSTPTQRRNDHAVIKEYPRCGIDNFLLTLPISDRY